MSSKPRLIKVRKAPNPNAKASQITEPEDFRPVPRARPVPAPRRAKPVPAPRKPRAKPIPAQRPVPAPRVEQVVEEKPKKRRVRKVVKKVVKAEPVEEKPKKRRVRKVVKAEPVEEKPKKRRVIKKVKKEEPKKIPKKKGKLQKVEKDEPVEETNNEGLKKNRMRINRMLKIIEMSMNKNTFEEFKKFWSGNQRLQKENFGEQDTSFNKMINKKLLKLEKEFRKN